MYVRVEMVSCCYPHSVVTLKDTGVGKSSQQAYLTLHQSWIYHLQITMHLPDFMTEPSERQLRPQSLLMSHRNIPFLPEPRGMPEVTI